MLASQFNSSLSYLTWMEWGENELKKKFYRESGVYEEWGENELKRKFYRESGMYEILVTKYERV